MSLISRAIVVVAVAGALAFAPAGPAVLGANGPPSAAPRTPVDVSPLPPVGDTAASVAPAVTPPPSAPVPAAAQQAWWQMPTFWALIALVETVGAFIATILYMRMPEQNRLVLALTMTGGSAVFIIVALAAWLL